MTSDTRPKKSRPATSSNPVFENVQGCLFSASVAIVILVTGSAHCFKARKQYLAASYPHVMGRMSKWEIDEFGTDGEWQLLVEYNYSVNGRRYFGTRKRFAWRHFNSESPAAQALARSWGQGNQVKVFYNPDDPSDAALDNLFTRGDRKTLWCAMGAICFATILLGVAIYDSLVRFPAYRQKQQIL